MRARIMAVNLVFVFAFVCTGASQRIGPSWPQPDSSQSSQTPSTGDEQPSTVESGQPRRMGNSRAEQRYRDLKKDSDKLLQLATELKQEVDRANAQVFSVDVVRKAEEIEKLARSVKNKMRGT